MPDKPNCESHGAGTASIVWAQALLFLSAFESLGVFLYNTYSYQQAGWWSRPSRGGTLVLAGLVVLAAVFSWLARQVHTHAERVRLLLGSVAKGNTYVVTFAVLALALVSILVILSYPAVALGIPLAGLRKHVDLSYLAMALILEASGLLASLKFKCCAMPVLRLLRRYHQVRRKARLPHPGIRMMALDSWLRRNELLSTSVIFVALIWLFFAPTLIQGKLPLSTSYLYQLTPWASYRGAFKSDMVYNPVLSDDYDFGIPGWQYIIGEIRSGRFPSWIPYVNGGAPFGFLVFGIFTLHGLAIALGGVKWGTMLYMCLKMYIAGISIYGYLRYRELARASALLGSLVLMFSAYIIVNGMSEVPDALIYAPAILYFADRFIKERKYWQFLCLALCVFVTILSGFPSVIMYTLLLVVFYLSYRNLLELRDRPLRQRIGNLAIIAAAFLIGISLAAFSLVPTYEYFRTINIGYRVGVGPETFIWYEIGRLVNANICGNPVQSSVDLL